MWCLILQRGDIRLKHGGNSVRVANKEGDGRTWNLWEEREATSLREEKVVGVESPPNPNLVSIICKL